MARATTPPRPKANPDKRRARRTAPSVRDRRDPRRRGGPNRLRDRSPGRRGPRASVGSRPGRPVPHGSSRVVRTADRADRRPADVARPHGAGESPRSATAVRRLRHSETTRRRRSRRSRPPPSRDRDRRRRVPARRGVRRRRSRWTRHVGRSAGGVHRRRRRRHRDARGQPPAAAAHRASPARSAHRRCAAPRAGAASGGCSWPCSCSLSSAPGWPCWARRCSRSRPTRCSVEGNVYTDRVRLQAVIDDLVGTPVLAADTQAAERELEAIPWVDQARVRTHFPHGATIDIRERVALATYAGPDGQFRVIDGDGRVLDVIAGQPIAYMLITGPDPVDRQPGEYAPVGLRRGRQVGPGPHRFGPRSGAVDRRHRRRLATPLVARRRHRGAVRRRQRSGDQARPSRDGARRRR